MMGSRDDEYGHQAREGYREVTLTRDFVIQQTELTQSQWVSSGFPNPSRDYPEGSDEGYKRGDCLDAQCQVGRVSWYDALAYANWLSDQEGLSRCFDLSACTGAPGAEDFVCETLSIAAPTVYECEGYRLPTAAEWEYAARAGVAAAYHNGGASIEVPLGDCYPQPALDEIGWYCANSDGQTHPVGGKLANQLGLYDMSGNAYEWTFDESGTGGEIDPGGVYTGKRLRIARGGNYQSQGTWCRSAGLLTSPEEGLGSGAGFRLVRSTADSD